MRKALIFSIFVVVSTVSCTKQDLNNVSDSSTIKKSTELSDYEYYDFSENYELELESFINAETTADPDITKAIWLLESSVNYKYRHVSGTYDNLQKDSLFVELPLTNENSSVDASALHQVYTDLEIFINNGVNLDDEIILVSDVKPHSIAGSELQISISVISTLGYQAAISRPALNANKNLQNAFKNRVYNNITSQYDYTFADCNDNPENTSAIFKSASLAYYKFNGFNAYYRYAMNVVRYPSLIQYSDLLGWTNAPYTYHTLAIPEDDCVTASEINTYRDIIHDRVSSLQSTDPRYNEVLSIKMEPTAHFSGNFAWRYEDVFFGEYAHTSEIYQ